MPADFRVPDVRPGDAILPAWRELQREEQAARVQLGRSARRMRTPMGTAITFDAPAQQWPHPFKASLAGSKISVRPGVVSNLTPGINGVALDDDKATPQLVIEGGPNDELRSFVCIRALVAEELGAIDPMDKTALSMLHVPDITTAAAEDEAGVLAGWHAIAMLKWSDTKTVRQIFQITHHNLQHKFYAATSTRAAQHVFFPA